MSTFKSDHPLRDNAPYPHLDDQKSEKVYGTNYIYFKVLCGEQYQERTIFTFSNVSTIFRHRATIPVTSFPGSRET